MPLGRTGSFLGPLHMVGQDEDSGHLPAVLGWKGRGLRGARGRSPRDRWGWCVLGRKVPPPRPHATLSHVPGLPAWRPLPAAPAHPGLGERQLGAWGRDVGEVTHWAWLRTWAHGTKDGPHALLREPRACPGLPPCQMGGSNRPGGGGVGRGRVRSTSRRTRPASPRSTGRGGSSPRA